MKLIKNRQPKGEKTEIKKYIINVLTPYFEYKNKKGTIVKYIIQ